MRKIILSLIMLSLALVSIFALSTKTKAEAETGSTSDWMPHNYVLSGYEIPTAMTYDENSVSFNGALNAGIATTGFNYLKAIDISNFSIDLDMTLPDADKLAWVCFCFLDTNLMMDAENTKAPVAMPFNAMSGKGGYSNKLQTGLVLQLDTTEILENYFKFNFVSKNVNSITGSKDGASGWFDQTEQIIERKVLMDNAFDGKFKLSISSNENGLAFNVNDGAWKTVNAETGEYTETKTQLNKDGAKGLQEYFSDKECYFSVVTMYADQEHRNVNFKVNSINGLNPSDNKTPSYLADKVIEKENIKVTVSKDALAEFGVYPGSVDSIKITKYDEEDGDYETIADKAKSLNATVIDFFKINPQVNGSNVGLKSSILVSYELPAGYDDFKAYYINDDDEAQAIPSSYVKNENGVLTIKVDNETITKVSILGLKAVDPIVDPSDGENDTTGGKKTGCKSSVIGLLPIAIGSLAIVSFKKKNEE